VRHLGILSALVLASCSSTPSAPASGTVTLSWVAPTRLNDGEALTDLAGYVVTYSKAGGLKQSDALSLVNSTTLTLPAGTYSFYVQAVSLAYGVGEPSQTLTATVP